MIENAVLMLHGPPIKQRKFSMSWKSSRGHDFQGPNLQPGEYEHHAPKHVESPHQEEHHEPDHEEPVHVHVEPEPEPVKQAPFVGFLRH